MAPRRLDYDRTTRRPTTGRDALGRDRSGPTTDEAMTRSGQELGVATTQPERGRGRLRKYLTTEQVQQTVPVRRERVGVEREPITDATLDAATDDGTEVGRHERRRRR